MFCLINLSGDGNGVVSYSAGPERYAELLSVTAAPAPYMARIHWIAAERWSAWRNTEWESEFRAAREHYTRQTAKEGARSFGTMPKPRARNSSANAGRSSPNAKGRQGRKKK